MKRTLKFLPVNFYVILFSLFALNFNSAFAQETDALPSGLDDLLTEIEDVYKSKDAERRAAIYKEDGVHVTGWGQAVKGKPAIKILYQNVFSQLDEVTNVEAIPVTVTVQGNYATVRGKFVWEAVNKKGESFSTTNHLAAHLEKINGEWKIVWDLTGPEVAKEN